MLFWVAAAALTIVCVAAALAPFMRGTSRADAPADHDLEVYKDQLAEIDRDGAAGLIAPEDAATARAEVARRILKVSAETDGGAAAPGAKLGRMSALAVAALLPVISWGAYSMLGAPEIPDQPIAARENPGDNSIDALVVKAEAHLAKNPDDGRGWDVLAPIYARMGRYDAAVNAFSRAIKLNTPSAARESGLGEALTGAAGGSVTAEAKAAFGRALALDPNEPKAQLFLAMGLVQEGKSAEAKTALEAQLAAAPADAPWRPVIINALASLEKSSQGKIAKGPSQAQVDAASQMSGEDRISMIETMVAGLAQKLKTEPDNMSDWQKLIRSYLVMGKKDEALKALENAGIAFRNDSAKQGEIRAFAKELGLSGS
jgi:cytochrome c-type biogenesis protein CcmH